MQVQSGDAGGRGRGRGRSRSQKGGASERVGNWDVACGGVTRTAFLTEKAESVRARAVVDLSSLGHVRTGAGQGRAGQGQDAGIMYLSVETSFHNPSLKLCAKLYRSYVGLRSWILAVGTDSLRNYHL